jgi:hypothetical protein
VVNDALDAAVERLLADVFACGKQGSRLQNALIGNRGN